MERTKTPTAQRRALEGPNNAGKAAHRAANSAEAKEPVGDMTRKATPIMIPDSQVNALEDSDFMGGHLTEKIPGTVHIKGHRVLSQGWTAPPNGYHFEAGEIRKPGIST